MVDKPKNSSEQPAPYDLIQDFPEQEGINNNNPLQGVLNKVLSNKTSAIEKIEYIIQRDITDKDFSEMLKIYVPTELKAGGALTTGDGKKTSYEELENIVQKVESVTSKDVSLKGKPLRVFIIPKYPPKGSNERKILNAHLEHFDNPNNAAYIQINDSVLLFQDFIDNNTKKELKGVFAHEVEHRIDFATNGRLIAKYNESKAIGSQLTDDFLTHCNADLTNGKIPTNLTPYHVSIIDTPPAKMMETEKCNNTLADISEKRIEAKSKTEQKNYELSRTLEYKADSYACIADKDFCDGLISLLKKIPNKAGLTHPKSDLRIETIIETKKNPDAARKSIEKAIENSLKIPLQTPSPPKQSPSNSRAGK